MTNRIKVALLSASLAAFLLPATAQNSGAATQTATPPTTAPAVTQPGPTGQPTGQNPTPKPEVSQRVNHQQERIGQGIQSGQLTAGEASHLENKESALNKEIRQDRQANGGKLTPAEKKQINQQQNHLSKQIYKDKHNNSKR